MNKENGPSWIPSPGVVPVLHPKFHAVHCDLGGASSVVVPILDPKELKRLKPSRGEAFLIARLLFECVAGERMEAWSTDAVRPLGDILLLGNSALPSHRWTLARAMLGKNDGAEEPAWRTARPASVMEDPLDPAEQLALKRVLENMDFTAGDMFPWGGNRLVAADFKRPLRLEDLPRLNREAQARGMVLVARAELEDVRGEPLDSESYATLAMQLAVERGIDFTRCARAVVVVEENALMRFKARLLSATDAEAGRQIEWDIREREWQAAEI